MRARRVVIPSSAAIARWMLPPKSMRSGPSSTATSTARAWLAPASRRAAAGGDLPAGIGLDEGKRALPRGQRRQHDPLHRLLVLGEDEIAEPPADLGLDRAMLAGDLLGIGAAYREFGLDLRIMGAEAELEAAVRHQRRDPGEQLVDMRF